MSDTDNVRPGFYRSAAGWGGAVTIGAIGGTAANYSSYGFPFFALLGTVADAGTTPNFTHTITPANANSVWNTLWMVQPTIGASTDIFRYEDGVVTGVEIIYAAGQPLKIAIDYQGKTVTRGATIPSTVTSTHVYSSTGAFLSSIGATLLMDSDATPASTPAQGFIQSASLKIMRETAMIQTSAVTPSHKSQGLFSVAFSASVVVTAAADMDYVRGTFFGSASGTTLSATVVSGSLDWLFNMAPTTDVNRSLKVQLPAVVYSVDPQHFDPGASALTLNIANELTKPASGAAITVVSADGQSAY